MKHKVIIDTDPGIDDAMAISFAINHPEIDLIGITTIFGNVDTNLATLNALRICEANEVTIPVSKGAVDGFSGVSLPAPSWVHGADGLGNIYLDIPTTKPQILNAVEFLKMQIEMYPNEVTIVAVGALTNIASLVTNYPETVTKVKQLIIMGGAINVVGNVTPLAEFNVACDVKAADIVFAANWDLVLVGLDVTGNTHLTRDDFAEIKSANPKYEFLCNAANNYIDFYTSQLGFNGCCMHDVCAVAHVVAPEILSLQEARLRVALKEDVSKGKTIAMPNFLETSLQSWIKRPVWESKQFPQDLQKWIERPVHKYAYAIDKNKMARLFVETLKYIN